MSVYLSFAIGLGRKCFGTKGFRVSLRLDLKGRKFFSSPYLIYLGEQCFCLCSKVFVEGLASWHGTEK